MYSSLRTLCHLGQFIALILCCLACEPQVIYNTKQMSLDLNGCFAGASCEQSLFNQTELGCYITEEQGQAGLVRRNPFRVNEEGRLFFEEELLSQSVGDRFLGTLFFFDGSIQTCNGFTPNSSCDSGCLLRLRHNEVTVGNQPTQIQFFTGTSCDASTENPLILAACYASEVDLGEVDLGEVDFGEVDMGGCTADLIGTVCEAEALGTCKRGVYACQDDRLTCVASEPSDETCDTIDNDCDGQIDESLGGEACSVGTGACETTGAIACVGGRFECAAPNMPMPNSDDESCDGIDSDCDGQVDEDYSVTMTMCGTGACEQLSPLFCVDGQIINDCVPLPAGPAQDDLCDGLDSDCDDRVDEAHQITTTSCGLGACAANGQLECQNGEILNTCIPSMANPTETDASCNQLDDDCDGQIDEAYPTQNTTCGLGVCANSGQESCQAGQIVNSCTPLPETDTNDTTCDGIDGDCDGRIDEGFETSVSECGLGVCQNSGQLSCINGTLVDSCVPGSRTRPTDENCNGLDDDCSGEVDEDFVPYASEPCGFGACQQQGTVRCQQGALVNDCTPLQSQTTQDSSCNNIDDDCDGNLDENYPVGQTSCGIGECSNTGESRCQNGAIVDTCQPITFVGDPDTCDGLDNDCDTRVDEGFVSQAVNCDPTVSCVNKGYSLCVNGQLTDSCDEPATRDSDADGVGDPCAWLSVQGLSIDVLRHEVTFGSYRDCVKAGACEINPINYQIDAQNNCEYIAESQVSTEPSTHPLRCLTVTTDPLFINDPDALNHPIHQLDQYCAWVGGRVPTVSELADLADALASSDCTQSNLRTCAGSLNSVAPVCSKEVVPGSFGSCDLVGNLWEISADFSIVSNNRRRYSVCFEHFGNNNDNYVNACAGQNEDRLGIIIGGRCVR